eukprot:1407432-Alexandrium_andersonii.AAC.1
MGTSGAGAGPRETRPLPARAWCWPLRDASVRVLLLGDSGRARPPPLRSRRARARAGGACATPCPLFLPILGRWAEVEWGGLPCVQ